MKRAFCFALLYVLALSAVLPANAQRAPIRSVPVSTSDEGVQFGNVMALSDGNGVLVKWDMIVETGNIGFYVYRVDGVSRELVNKNIILGSAARISRYRPVYGQQYEVFDPAGSTASSYVVESIPENGRVVDSQATRAQRTGRLSQFALSSQDLESRDLQATSFIEKEGTPNAPLVSLPPDLINQRIIAAQPGIKIAVRKEGLYRVTKAELAAAAPVGFDVNGSSTNWQLFGDGNEQAINVAVSNAYIEFYGKPIDTVESATREYYLINGASAGKRIAPHFPKAIAGNVLAGNGRVIAETRQRNAYWDTIFNGDAENFFGDPITPFSQTTFPFSVTGIDTSVATATLTVKLQGFTSRTHSVAVTLNGSSVGNVTTTNPGGGAIPYQTSFSISTALLKEGNNLLGLQAAVVPVGEPFDFSLFDLVKVDLARKFQPDQNRLAFTSPQSRKISVGPFLSPTTSTVTIMDTVQPVVNDTDPVAASTTAGILRLSSPVYRAGEVNSSNVATTARITISRVFGNTGPVSVDLNLANGTAIGGASCSAGVDYVFPASPTVSLPNGVNSANVDVPLCNDGVSEPNGETFTATLSNPSGAALATNNIKIFDTTYEGAIAQVTSLPIQNQGGALSFNFPAYRASSMYAVDEAYELQSPEVIANTPSTLTSPGDATNAADMVIITSSTPGFKAAAEIWADYRRNEAQHYKVKVVDIADVMDEFNYGSVSTSAITSFLNYAQTSANWSTHPQYVMLIGDASYDPRNYLNNSYLSGVPLGSYSLIPMKFVTTAESETGSDEALADFNGDGLTEIATGRIPVRTVADITNIYNKTVRFETPSQMSFSRGGVFIFDQNKNPGDDFSGNTLTLRNEMTNMPSTTMIDRGASNSGRPATVAALSNGPTGVAGQPGPYIVNWSGHGASGLWNNDAFISIINTSDINNPNNESVYTMLSCLNAFFFIPDNGDSLSEALLKAPNKAAVATWASTGLTTADKQIIMGQQFYKKLNDGTIPRIGDLIRNAKAALVDGQGNPYGPEVRLSWALLGDPLLKMR